MRVNEQSKYLCTTLVLTQCLQPGHQTQLNRQPCILSWSFLSQLMHAEEQAMDDRQNSDAPAVQSRAVSVTCHCCVIHTQAQHTAIIRKNSFWLIDQLILITAALHKLGFALCCHSNATRAPIANLPNSAQLGAASTTPPSYIRVRAVVWAYGRGQTDTQTHTQTDTQTRMTTIHFASSTTHAKCNNHLMAMLATTISLKRNIFFYKICTNSSTNINNLTRTM